MKQEINLPFTECFILGIKILISMLDIYLIGALSPVRTIPKVYNHISTKVI